MDLVRREVARIEATNKGPPILIENIKTAAARAIADGETARHERADTQEKAQRTAEKLRRLAAANGAAQELVGTLSDDRIAELHRQVLDGCQPLKRESWQRVDPRANLGLMREIARLVRKSKAEVPA